MSCLWLWPVVLPVTVDRAVAVQVSGPDAKMGLVSVKGQFPNFAWACVWLVTIIERAEEVMTEWQGQRRDELTP